MSQIWPERSVEEACPPRISATGGTNKEKKQPFDCDQRAAFDKWRGQDLNLRPRGYEPRELPGCSTPRHCVNCD